MLRNVNKLRRIWKYKNMKHDQGERNEGNNEESEERYGEADGSSMNSSALESRSLVNTALRPLLLNV